MNDYKNKKHAKSIPGKRLIDMLLEVSKIGWCRGCKCYTNYFISSSWKGGCLYKKIKCCKKCFRINKYKK